MLAVTLKPVITEKSMRLAAAGTYMFDVNMAANKPLVAQAVKEQFKVDAIDVRIAISKGKVKRFRGISGRRKDSKRAYVKVKKGQKITAFDFSGEEEKK